MSLAFEELEKHARALSLEEKAALARILIEELDTASDPNAEELCLQSLTSAVNEKHLDEIMIEVMNCAQWIRVDLELLLRTSFWLTLSVNELRARVVADQKDLMQKFKSRLKLSDSEIETLLKRADDLLKELPPTNKQVENNAQIVERDIWHKDNLAK